MREEHPVRTGIVVAALLAAMPALARAQTCTGSTSFEHRPFQAYGGAVFGGDSRSFNGGLGIGGASLFGRLGVGATTEAELHVGWTVWSPYSHRFAGTVGYEFSITPDGVIALCPTASFAFQAGPDAHVSSDPPDELERSGGEGAVGLEVALVAARSDQVQVLPHVSLAVGSAAWRLTSRRYGQTRSPGHDSFVRVGVGFGLLFFQRSALRLGAVIDVRGDHSTTTTFGTSLSVAFGPH